MYAQARQRVGVAQRARAHSAAAVGREELVRQIPPLLDSLNTPLKRVYPGYHQTKVLLNRAKPELDAVEPIAVRIKLRPNRR
jgi:hypothetical protein